MTRPMSDQALRLAAFVRPFSSDAGPKNFRAYKQAMLATLQRPGPRLSKLKQIEHAISRPEGASLAELMALTGWQAHSIRGAISAGLRKKRGLVIVSQRRESTRAYLFPDHARKSP